MSFDWPFLPTKTARIRSSLRGQRVLVPLMLLLTVAEVETQPSPTPVGPERFGGRTRALVVIEGRAGGLTLLAGSAGGGLWRSKDAGDTWEAVAGFEGEAVTSLVVDPSDSDKVYAGTGEIDQRLAGSGIYFSGNGGERWAPIPGSKRPELRFIKRISLSADGQEMLVATAEGLFGSSTSNSDFRCALEILGGCAEAMSDVTFHPRRSDKEKAVAASAVNAGVFYRERDPATGQIQWHASKAEWSTTSSGETWQIWRGDVALAYAKAKPDIVYASVNGAEFHPPIWRSEDGGKTFKPRDVTLAPCVSHLNPTVNQGGWSNFVWAGHEDDEDFLILGRVDLWRSSDGGTSLAHLSDFDKHPLSVHADPHVLASRSDFGVPGGSSDVWVGSDGGVFYTADLEAAPSPCQPVDWQERNDGYASAQVYAATALPDGTLLAGTQDLGILRRQPLSGCARGRSCWTTGQIEKGSARTPVRDDVDAVVPHPAIASAAFALGIDFHVLRTTNAGVTWQYISDQRWNGAGWVPAPVVWPVEGFTTNHLRPALAIDRQQPPELYLAGGCLYRTWNLMAPIAATTGPEWHQVDAPLRKQACESRPYIVAIAPTPTDPEDLWICYDDGRLFRTANAYDTNGQSWHGVRGREDVRRERPCQSLVVTDAGTAWVAYGAFDRQPIVYRVEDKRPADPRYAWTAFPLPDGAYPHEIKAHPTIDQWVFVATELGVFGKLNTDPWRLVAGLPPRKTESIFWHDQKLFAATYGSGLFVTRP